MKGPEGFAAIRPSNPKGIEGRHREDAMILARFTESERQEIVRKQKQLSTLGLFIGKDFDMPVLLNEPGAGWHWDFKDNHIKIDPIDLLEKPLDYLRFVISHEGGHRRISRTEFIPEEVWRQPGFSFMMNAIEDPRDNNFVADAYPKFREQMALAYSMEEEFEAEAKKASKDKMGSVPRFVQAGHQYIRQWFNEVQGKPMEIDPSLPEDVQDVVRETLSAAQDSWWRYPSKEEADESEELISRYAEASYRINLEKVWPAFSKLVEADIQDEQIRQALEDMRKEQGEGEQGGERGEPGGDTGDEGNEAGESEGEGRGSSRGGERGEVSKGAKSGGPSGSESSGSAAIPEDLKGALTPGERQELEKAIELAKDGSGAPVPIDASQLSPELREKLEAYIESLPDETKRELAEKARKIFEELEEEINKALEGKLVEHGPQESSEPVQRTQGEVTGDMQPIRDTEIEGAEQIREKLDELLSGDRSEYARVRQEVLPIIDRLEDDLRELFVARRARAWEAGHKFGKRINLKRRIQEKAKGVSAVDSRAWEKREAPTEKDYAISLLVDLSGSMRGNKIRETFKAVVVLCETLNKLSIKTEILGFNDRIHEYQDFTTTLSEDVRGAMGNMLHEVHSSRAQFNDDGWALKQASARLTREEAAEKFLIVLSDGIPEESFVHNTAEYRLENVVRQITEETDQKLIGLGIGSGTGHVEQYYPNSLANIPVRDMAEKLADLIREAIDNYQDF